MTVVDIEDEPGVDIVGDVTDPITLEEADVASSEAIVLALSDDTTALFAALVARQVAPETGIIARANEDDSTPKLYRAGAKYVLSLPTVSGRMLASKLLDEEVITPRRRWKSSGERRRRWWAEPSARPTCAPGPAVP
ncbi:voltage-gated potassium channel [Halolamina pelagica]|uniref:Voltage-gated potassium channel n=1 Tax=Halolamina pelagica TaxID=699431 RepID=A0A0P7FXF2_9EURY|nr:voltage-gated potassium channel [Halolamina pelagica]